MAGGPLLLGAGIGREGGAEVSHDPAMDNERHQRVYCGICGLRADYSDRLDTWVCGCGAQYRYEESRWMDFDEVEGEGEPE